MSPPPSEDKAFGGALEVAAIGGQRMPRGASFGRHHVEEAVDQRAVVGAHDRDLPAGHVRDSASAAIIRAV